MDNLSIDATYVQLAYGIAQLSPEAGLVRNQPQLWLMFSEQPKHRGDTDAVGFVGFLALPGELGYRIAPFGTVLVGGDCFGQLLEPRDSRAGANYHPILQQVVLALREVLNPSVRERATSMRDIIEHVGGAFYEVLEDLFPAGADPAGFRDLPETVSTSSP